MNRHHPRDYEQPPGVTLVKDLGELWLPGGHQDLGERLYSYYVGDDGNMWTWLVPEGGTFTWPQKQIWQNDGRPPGTGIAEPMGVVIVSTYFPFVFVSGADGCLWTRWWTGAEFLWTNLGRPGSAAPVQSMGLLLTEDQRPLIFLKATDGNLWLCQWASDHWEWGNSGNAGVDMLGSVAVAFVGPNERPYNWVRCADGNLWCCWWDGGAWQWTNHGVPEAGAVVTDGGMGVSAMEGEFVSVIVGTTHGVWELNWRGSRGSWLWIRKG